MPRLTITEIAGHVGVHKSTVSRQVAAHGLKGADGKVDLDQYQALRAGGLDPVLQTSGAAAIGGGDAEGGLAAERLRKMAADAQLAELALARQKAELLDAAQVEAAQEDMARQLRDRILQVPREVAGDCARLSDEIAIEASMTMALRRALDGLTKEFNADAAGRAA
jgi:DNA-binding MurR/RpiR family transcriptional regulator